MNKLARIPTFDRAARASARHLLRARRQPARYFAFLSYSHKDEELAGWLHEQLEQFRVPRALRGQLTENGVIPARLRPVFRDRHELAAADDLGEEIEEALAHSRFLIVLCSPEAAKSRWTNAEIEAFKRAHPDGCVLAAIAAGEPFASDTRDRQAEECFPPALRQKYDRRGRPTGKRAEPLAADLRQPGEARRLGLMKLIAGMLGVGLDELVQRESARRQRRLAWLAAASVAGMAVTSTLAITAIQARDEAREQRRQAEGLIEFMVGDLRDKLEPLGKLDVLDGVGSRVLAYYSRQDTSRLSDDALMQRSKALNLMAEVAYERGNLDEARDLYRQAVGGTAEAVRRSPNDAERLFQHAQNVFWVGEIAREAGRPKESESAYREYRRIADQMTQLEPDNLKYRMEVLYAKEDVGISLYDQHRFAEASAQFEGAAGPMEKLASLYPSNMTYQTEYPNILGWVADSQRAQGNLDSAIAVRERQVAFLKQLLANSADPVVRKALIYDHKGLGVVLAEKGDYDRAISEMQAGVAEAEELIPVEPRNAVWKSEAAAARLQLAGTLMSLNRTADAAQQTSAGCALANALPSTFAISGRARLHTMCAMLGATVAMASGATEQALKSGSEAVASARTEHSEDPLSDRYWIANAYRLLGDVRKRAGDSAGATNAWSAGLAELPTGVSERPWDMNVRAELLARLGRSEELAPVSARLKAIDYHAIN